MANLQDFIHSVSYKNVGILEICNIEALPINPPPKPSITGMKANRSKTYEYNREDSYELVTLSNQPILMNDTRK